MNKRCKLSRIRNHKTLVRMRNCGGEVRPLPEWLLTLHGGLGHAAHITAPHQAGHHLVEYAG
jgi:hypothetical protein